MCHEDKGMKTCIHTKFGSICHLGGNEKKIEIEDLESVSPLPFEQKH